VFAYLTFSFGRVEGEEFCPETFERRSFVYYEMPLLRLQVWPIDRRDVTGSLESFLTGEDFLVVEELSDDEKRWDLVQATRGWESQPGVNTTAGDAEILCRYLRSVNSEDDVVWLEWTKKNRPLAKVLWPPIAKLARDHLYLLAPELFQAARRARDADHLASRIQEILADRYLVLARAQQQLGRHQQAIDLFDEVLTYAPDSREAFEGRAISHAELGNLDQAAADRARATTSDHSSS
jgi:tetratricopeptide (TPR) repeat protein